MEIDIPLLKATLKLRGLVYRNVYERIGMPLTTFNNKLRTEGFTVKEAQAIAEVIPLSREEVLSIFFPRLK